MTFLDIPPLPAVTTESELDRIVLLPRRPVIDCERGPDRHWSPEAEALIAVETAKFSRGPRISCACRDRHLVAKPGGDLLIFQEGLPNRPPPLPVHTKIADFVREVHDVTSGQDDNGVIPKVSQMRPGDTLFLKGLDRPCITMLNPVQAWLARELPKAGGAFGFLPIGSGKTLAAFFAVVAMRSRVRDVVLLAKSDQRLHYASHYVHAREHWYVPSLVMDKFDLRGSYVVPGMPVVRFVPYTKLQDRRSTNLLEDCRPDMIVADEAHSLAAIPSPRRGAGSARAARFVRYMKQRNAEGSPVILCAWSGSLVNKSILDMTHIAAYALGMGSPYPIPQDIAGKWADVVDPSYLSDTSSSVARALRKAFGKPSQGVGDLLGGDGIREGIRQRAVETLGVISARSASVSASLSLHERKLPKMPQVIKDALEMVRGYERPDGDEIVEEVKRIAIARNCALGFYPYWIFPGASCECVGGSPRCARCARIDDWYAKRKAFGKELRAKLLESEPHLDSKALCVNAARRAYQVPPYEGDLPVWPSAHWQAWAAVENTIRHDKREKWLDEYAARDAAEWATENVGVVWYESVCFGEKVAKLAGINCHGGGNGAEARILAEDGKKSICASISSHSEGRDGLQYRFHRQLVCEPPASGKGWDQLLGRLLREGQKADEVETWVYLPTSEVRDAMRKAITYAEFDEELAPTRSTLFAASGALRSADLDFEV